MVIHVDDMEHFASRELELLTEKLASVRRDIAMILRNKPDGVFAYEVADEIEDG